MYNFIVLLFAFIYSTQTAVILPKYFKLCSKSDPNFNKCGLENGREAISHIVYGDKSLRILPLSPLKLPFIQLENRADFQLNLTDVDIIGLDKAELVDFEADLDKRQIKVTITLDEILIKGDFHTDGRILFFPLKGDGPGSLIAYGGTYKFTFHYDLVKKNGAEYAKITENDFGFTITKAVFDADQLFKDERLAKQTTQFLNENWEIIVQDFQHVVGATIGKICKNLVSAVFERVPFSSIILP